jgi:CDP-diacylglycerol--glycerol-3-phosphate 3-phosphatidyltransferase
MRPPAWATFNLANRLTLLRIALIAPMVGLLLMRHYVATLAGIAIFIVAALTDYFDGRLAREHGWVTAFGKIMDPLADKLLMTSLFISLVELGVAPGWMVIVIIGREMAVTGLRVLAALDGQVLAASAWGKIKTVFQMTGVILLLLLLAMHQGLASIQAVGGGSAMPAFGLLLAGIFPPLRFWILLGITLVTLISGWDYFQRNLRVWIPKP